jgi:hypothetical protein
MKLCADRTGTASLVLGATTRVPSTGYAHQGGRCTYRAGGLRP